jgi:hypothetical protein
MAIVVSHVTARDVTAVILPNMPNINQELHRASCGYHGRHGRRIVEVVSCG